MITIIAGGRDYAVTSADAEYLDTLDITQVVSGGASGADRGGEQWAENRGIPLTVIKAEWKSYGRAAGPIRNRRMADIADAVVLFAGGAGTSSMFRIAMVRGLRVFDCREGSDQPLAL